MKKKKRSCLKPVELNYDELCQLAEFAEGPAGLIELHLSAERVLASMTRGTDVAVMRFTVKDERFK